MKRHLLLMLVAGLAYTSFAWAQTPSEFKGHTGSVHSVTFDKSGKILASGSFDKTVKLWDFATGKNIQTFNHGSMVYSVAFSPNEEVASGGADNLIKVWNPKDGKSLREMKGHSGIVASIAYSPDGSILVSGSADKSVRLWDAKTGKELKNLGSHKESVYAVAFSPNGQLVASGSNDGALKVWDVKGQKEIKEMLAEPLKLVYLEEKKTEKKEEKKKEEKKKEVKKDTKKDMKGKKQEMSKDLRDNVTGIAFTPDSKQVLAVGFDKMLRVWDVAQGKEVKHLGPIPNWINGVTVARDGKQVAVAGYGGALHAWDVGTWKDDGGTKLPKSIIFSITFTPDGKALVTGHENPDHVIKVTPMNALTVAPPAPAKKK